MESGNRKSGLCPTRRSTRMKGTEKTKTGTKLRQASECHIKGDGEGRRGKDGSIHKHRYRSYEYISYPCPLRFLPSRLRLTHLQGPGCYFSFNFFIQLYFTCLKL